MEFGKDPHYKKLMWKEEAEAGGGTVHISENAKIKVGHYECSETDKIEVSQNHITIIAGGESHRVDTTVDIETVMKGETAFEFLCKCISNPKAFSHFLDHTSSDMIQTEEKRELLRRARIKGDYRTAIALEQSGVSLKSDDALQDDLRFKLEKTEKMVQELSKELSSLAEAKALKKRPHQLLSLFKRKSS